MRNSDRLYRSHELSSGTQTFGDIMVSYDVVSLFTNVPLMETIQYLVEKALRDDWLFRTHSIKLSAENLTELLYAATRDQLFTHDGKLFEQFEGVAMGSPLGPLMANACMCMLEEKLVDYGAMPLYYRRYVDDTIATFSSLEEHEIFFTQLNALHSSIQFTAELSSNNVLPFIGVNCHKVGSSIETSVYHKPTDNGLLLHYHSHTDQRYKRSLLRTMITRAYRISSSWHHLHSECEKIRDVFCRLSYPTSLVDRTIKDVIAKALPVKTNQQTQEVGHACSRFILPFKSQELCKRIRDEIKGLNDKLDLKMQPVFTSVKIKRLITAGQPASNANEKLVSQAKVVYTYKCSCDLSYIGYTARYLYQRINEHRHRSSSSIHQHCQDTGHEFKVTNFKVLAKCKTKLDCMIRESHEIYFRKPALNARDEYSCSILYRLRL